MVVRSWYNQFTEVETGGCVLQPRETELLHPRVIFSGCVEVAGWKHDIYIDDEHRHPVGVTL